MADPPATVAPSLPMSELLHSTGASLHTPESFGRAIISAALTGMAQSGNGTLESREVPATFKVRSVRSATEIDAAPVCIDVCAGFLGVEICIHVVVPAEIVGLF